MNQQQNPETAKGGPVACSDVLDGFLSMETAPKDGIEIILLIRHINYQYADEKDKSMWQQECKARWTDCNGGGWVWHGLFGYCLGWKPVPSNMWITNAFPEDVLPEDLAYRVIGDPKATEKRTVEELKKLGLVGIYENKAASAKQSDIDGEGRTLGQIAYEAAAAQSGCAQPWGEANQAEWEAAAQAVKQCVVEGGGFNSSP